MADLQPLIIPLDSQIAQRHNAGGKGENLSQLLRAGFAVPPGFIITTAAYLEYVSQNALTFKFDQLISLIDPKGSQQLEVVSSQIRDLFNSGQIASNTKDQILAAFESLERQLVAVRSSATAEDLPGISFAGQQDTYLNIKDPDDLIKAVVSSWSSLWTARAIGYRDRYNIPQDQVAIAVIIQEMVPSLSSGVLFTANPLSGSRSEMVIDAIFGLGELLVSGQVEPDHYLIDVDSMEIKGRTIGAKSTALYAEESGGSTNLEITAHDQTVLSDQEIIQLTELGIQIEDLFEFPQDVEWAIADDQIYILQSRPITTLFPIPEEPSATPMRVYFSFAAVQGVLSPITPLGQDAMRWLFAGGASLFDLDFDYQTQPLIKMAGERLWIDITHALRNPLGSRLMRRFISVVDPGTVFLLEELLEDPEGAFVKGSLRLSTFRRMLGFVVPFLWKVYGFVRSPEGQAEQVHQQNMAEISRLKDKYPSTPDEPLPIKEILNLYKEIRTGFPYAVPQIAAAAGGGILPFFLLNKLTQHLTGSNQLALEVTRGLPNNVTTEMDLRLWGIAKEFRSNEEAFAQFSSLDSARLAAMYSTRQLPEAAQSAIDNFMGTYGMRGLGEIDLGRKRWREDPTYVIEIILNYLQIEDPALAPDIIFQEGERAAEAAVKELQTIARKTFGGQLKAKVINFLAVRVRALAGLRESPKFFIVQLMGVIRQGLFDYGQQMVADGKIDQAEDIFYLFYSELEQLLEDTDQDWRSVVAFRRDIYQGELFRRQIPRLLLSDGRAFYEGISSLEGQTDKIVGSPVSPGLVEGDVRVVVDPINPGLKPGEIMVCQGTDPAWTPLFLIAGGVIMEVGGMMTHGAIVAREYGIPAVVGVSQATEVLQSGQRIQLNGSTGEILLLGS